jgi:8-oxo-dGTP pyrophosphatase MutT (NUDIX family)
MARKPIPTWTIALTVVQSQGRFLLVKERKHGGGWYLPAGRVEEGETLEQGAVREAAEEAGLEVRLTGIHQLQYTPQLDGSARLRVIFLGVPAAGEALKERPDEHSDAAGWFTFEQVKKLHLRGSEVLDIFEEVLKSPGCPLSLLGQEGRGKGG